MKFCKGTKAYWENITFHAGAIPDIIKFSSDRNTVVVFEIFNQDQIVPYFISDRHQGISSIYVSQKYTQTPKIIRPFYGAQEVGMI